MGRSTGSQSSVGPCEGIPPCQVLARVGAAAWSLSLSADTALTPQVPVLRPMDLMVEATPRRVFANAHTYHINSISVNSDYETYMSADDLRINLWNFEITNQSFSILWCVCGSGDGAGCQRGAAPREAAGLCPQLWGGDRVGTAAAPSPTPGCGASLQELHPLQGWQEFRSTK